MGTKVFTSPSSIVAALTTSPSFSLSKLASNSPSYLALTFSSVRTEEQVNAVLVRN